MSKVTLSVIIPVYNEDETIGKVLEKLSQVSAVAEIVVVDDGSKDTTAQVVRDAKKVS